MKLTCQQSDLAGAVSTVERAVATRDAHPLLSGIHLEADGTRLRLSATDLELGITCHIGADVETSGNVVLDARTFSQMVRKLPDDDVTLTRLEDGRLQMRAGRVQYELRTMRSEDYPALPVLADGVRVQIPEALFKKMIRQTAFAASHDEARAFLTGVLVEIEGDEIRLVATDSNRLSYRQAKLAQAPAQPVRSIVPARAMNELLRILQNSEEPVDIHLTDSQASFEVGSTRLVTRLLEGNFPNYRHVFPKEEAIVVHVSRDRFIDALERASLVARKGPAVATLTVGEETLRIGAREAEVGQLEEEIDIRLEGQTGQNAFQVRFLLEVLKTLESEEVTMGLNEGDRQATIRVPDDADFLYILMPVRLS